MKDRMSRIGAVLVIALALTGCSQKTEQASETMSDSLLAANPVEPPQTGITPQTDFQPEPVREEPPPPPVALKPYHSRLFAPLLTTRSMEVVLGLLVNRALRPTDRAPSTNVPPPTMLPL